MASERLTAESCRSCGACCITFEDQGYWADVEAKDEARLGKRFVRLNVVRRFAGAGIKTEWKPQKTGPLAGIHACVCVALRGSVMSRTSCKIYERRPEVCRKAVKPGDRGCREIRRLMREAIKEAEESR
jgi:Fe-S-cluster containining protein